MIAKPGVKVITSPSRNAIEVNWDYILKGKLSELRSCSMRLGTGKDNSEITWTSRLNCRGNYKHGHVKERLEEGDIPETNKGEHVYCQFLFEAKYVLHETTGEITLNEERECGTSEIVTLISLANSAKFKAMMKDKIESASPTVWSS